MVMPVKTAATVLGLTPGKTHSVISLLKPQKTWFREQICVTWTCGSHFILRPLLVRTKDSLSLHLQDGALDRLHQIKVHSL